MHRNGNRSGEQRTISRGFFNLRPPIVAENSDPFRAMYTAMIIDVR
jgi:hypothetical protein